MNKEFFTKLKMQLVKKYDKYELTDLLIKNKTRRVSNLLCAALNYKVIYGGKIVETSNNDWYEQEAINGFVAIVKAIGPQSWFYKSLTKDYWKEYLEEIEFTSLSDPGTIDRIWNFEEATALAEFLENKYDKEKQQKRANFAKRGFRGRKKIKKF